MVSEVFDRHTVSRAYPHAIHEEHRFTSQLTVSSTADQSLEEKRRLSSDFQLAHVLRM